MQFKKFLLESTRTDIQTLSQNVLGNLDDDITLPATVLADYIQDQCGNYQKANWIKEKIGQQKDMGSTYWRTEILGVFYRALDVAAANGFFPIRGLWDPKYHTAARCVGVIPNENNKKFAMSPALSQPRYLQYDALAILKKDVVTECFNRQVSFCDYATMYGDFVQLDKSNMIIETYPTLFTTTREPEIKQFWPAFEHLSSTYIYKKLRIGKTMPKNDDITDDQFAQIVRKFHNPKNIQIINDYEASTSNPQD